MNQRASPASVFRFSYTAIPASSPRKRECRSNMVKQALIFHENTPL
jgi:hypothetical protein